MRSADRSPRRRASMPGRMSGPVAALLLSLLACGVVPRPQPPAPTPIVVTVVVTAASKATPSQQPSTEIPSVTEPPEPIATLTLAPPPKPAPPKTSTQAPDGNNMDNFRISLDFNPAYLLRVYVFYSEDPNEQFKAKKDGRGIDSVDFKVTSVDGSKTYWKNSEKHAGYCIFGGGEPNCNPWTFEDGQYKWKSGGAPVKSGNYGLTVTVNPDNSDNGAGLWRWTGDSGNPIHVTLP